MLDARRQDAGEFSADGEDVMSDRSAVHDGAEQLDVSAAVAGKLGDELFAFDHAVGLYERDAASGEI